MPVPGDFRPLPFLANPHVQTVLSALWNGPPPPVADREQHVALPDGDRLVLHDRVPPRWRPGDRIALLVHGLGGSHRSGYMGRFAELLLPHGFRVVRLDLRGVGRGEALARRTYHGGCSDDVRAAAEALHRLSPESPLALIGLSLGGNIALKLAGEAADKPLPNLERVAAVSPPIDLTRCAALLALPRNRFYETHYLRALVAQVRRHGRRFPDLPLVRFPRRLTMRLFDDLCTAPRCGFADALDYYRRASALPVIPRIRVPAFILTARDDQFIDVAPFEALGAPPHVEVQVTERGGHLGFLGRDGSGGVRWAERRVVEWVLRGPPQR
jgi:predicted alpha/beta-fold hydrolase